MTLYRAHEGKDYLIENITLEDTELKSFLFTLGIFEGGTLRLISRFKKNLVIAARNGRYSIDLAIADGIYLAEERG